ncbi:hypothetical protein IWQ60_000250 [Tieghemiomyces parasiticus]|uniref:Uncharacterized protein n=1 Tax=Tieghemiomyces parasiticus TaxID=78921 RepID=A0A9W8DXR3_9FUNG|nr:hypothetical protein IWQ60_000250 [Tieghemiomyces parasiticus]
MKLTVMSLALLIAVYALPNEKSSNQYISFSSIESNFKPQSGQQDYTKGMQNYGGSTAALPSSNEMTSFHNDGSLEIVAGYLHNDLLCYAASLKRAAPYVNAEYFRRETLDIYQNALERGPVGIVVKVDDLGTVGVNDLSSVNRVLAWARSDRIGDVVKVYQTMIQSIAEGGPQFDGFAKNLLPKELYASFLAPVSTPTAVGAAGETSKYRPVSAQGLLNDYMMRHLTPQVALAFISMGNYDGYLRFVEKVVKISADSLDKHSVDTFKQGLLNSYLMALSLSHKYESRAAFNNAVGRNPDKYFFSFVDGVTDQ